MPHIPDSAHDTHDLELVAAYAAGDARDADLERAVALVASCADCAALHHDLRAISAAMPDLPARPRSRDFRLTPAQAAALRPSGLRGLLGALSGPRFAFATPLGTGLAALGIVGVLVASGGLPASSPSAGAAASASTADAVLEAPAASLAPDSEALTLASRAASADDGNEPVPDPAAAQSPGMDTSGGGELYGVAAGSPAAPVDGDTGGNRDVAAPDAGDVAATEAASTPASGEPPPVPAVLLALLGIALLVVRWGARRLD